GEFYKHINQIKKGLNAEGHHLRDKVAKVEYAKAKLNTEALKAQAQKIADAHKAVDPKAKAKTADEKHTEVTAKAAADAARLKALAAAVPPKPGVRAASRKLGDRWWYWTVGNPSYFSAFINGRLDLYGSDTSVSFSGEAHAGGTILGHKVNVL